MLMKWAQQFCAETEKAYKIGKAPYYGADNGGILKNISK